MKEVIQ